MKSRQLSNKPAKSSQLSNKPVKSSQLSNKPVSLIAEFSTREIKVPRVVREQLVKNR